MRVHPTSVVVSPSESSQSAAEVCTPVGCVAPDLADATAVVLAMLALAVVVGLTYLPEARRLLARECTRTRREREAFESFADRVDDLSVRRPGGATRPVGDAIAVDAAPDGASTRDVRRAYRETVMAVDHYAEEYDESLRTHLGAETGAEVATAVAEDQLLTPGLRQAVVTRARRTAAARAGLLADLRAEEEALAGAADRLSSIEAALADVRPVRETWPFEPLADAYWRLADREEAGRSVLADRQEGLQDGGIDLAAYLYEPLPVSHPVLAEGTDLLAEVRTTRAELAGAIATG